MGVAPHRRGPPAGPPGSPQRACAGLGGASPSAEKGKGWARRRGVSDGGERENRRRRRGRDAQGARRAGRRRSGGGQWPRGAARGTTAPGEAGGRVQGAPSGRWAVSSRPPRLAAGRRGGFGRSGARSRAASAVRPTGEKTREKRTRPGRGTGILPGRSAPCRTARRAPARSSRAIRSASAWSRCCGASSIWRASHGDRRHRHPQPGKDGPRGVSTQSRAGAREQPSDAIKDWRNAGRAGEGRGRTGRGFAWVVRSPRAPGRWWGTKALASSGLSAPVE